MGKGKFTFKTAATVASDDDRILRFVSTDELEDRDGDIVDFDGWKFDNYLQNPVVLYGHEHRGLPVGKTLQIHKDPITRRIEHDIQFPTADEYAFADTVYRLAKGGYINSVSVGFIGLKSEPRFDGDGHWIGIHFMEQELLELSIVPVPANPRALQEAKCKGIITEGEYVTLSELPMFDMVVDVGTDGEAAKVFVVGNNGERVAQVKMDDEYLQRLVDTHNKTGAEISAKNKSIIDGCRERLQKTIDDLSELVEPINGGEGDDPKSHDGEHAKSPKSDTDAPGADEKTAGQAKEKATPGTVDNVPDDIELEAMPSEDIDLSDFDVAGIIAEAIGDALGKEGVTS